ncbi:hypothetical protein BLA29_000045 [Euroglyphus maynei]|uniref:Uncharacterized protein n=1 Tax=Euroglyphus maynei TaxID=6958 RepID=A0A1Y3AZN7_EURMA|nr:hypothetical protein BLA29_000045 [Euroglyphus maynei]
MNKQQQATDTEKVSRIIHIQHDYDGGENNDQFCNYKYRMLILCSLGLYLAILLGASITTMVISNKDLCSMATFMLFTSIIALICYADSHCCSNSWLNISLDNQAQNLFPETDIA